MDQQIQQKIGMPNYKKIYQDMISKKYPDKTSVCSPILAKKNLSFFDILRINEIIFGSPKKETNIFNQRHRSYDKQAIYDILEYQKKNKLNNSQLSIHFKLSRNTIAKWRRIFLL